MSNGKYSSARRVEQIEIIATPIELAEAVSRACENWTIVSPSLHWNIDILEIFFWTTIPEKAFV